jgi:hypothetical protein
MNPITANPSHSRSVMSGRCRMLAGRTVGLILLCDHRPFGWALSRARHDDGRERQPARPPPGEPESRADIWRCT